MRAGAARHPADDVVIACGIWGLTVAALAGVAPPLTPVALPYVHGPPRPAVGDARGPFVRWPEQHVYARDHGDRDGFGSYDHRPIPIEPDDIGATAHRPWQPGSFDPAIQQAMQLLPPSSRFTPMSRLNGLFSMTADNLPLLGPTRHATGLWIAEAIWVTHAAGAAQALVQLMTGQEPTLAGIDTLAPDRFDGQPREELPERVGN